MSDPTPGATGQDSRTDRAFRGRSRSRDRRRERFSGPVGAGAARAVPLVLLVVALAGAVMLILAEFTPVIRIVVGDDVTKKTIDGGGRHAYSLLLIGLAGGAMAVGAWRGGSRPAMAAVAALGALALLIAVVRDIPALDDTGVYGIQYEDASAGPAAGFYLETLGGALMLIAGGAWLMLAGGSSGGDGGGSDRAGVRPRPDGPHDDAPEPEGEPALR